MIKVQYRAVDGAAETRKFKTLAGAQAYAAKMIGDTPEMGSRYAVSGDGIGRVMVDGANLADLFPELKAPSKWLVANYFDSTGQGYTLRVQRGNEVWGLYSDWSEAQSAADRANAERDKAIEP